MLDKAQSLALRFFTIIRMISFKQNCIRLMGPDPSKPELPPDQAVPPGNQYLKVNNASGTNLKLTFPLSPDDRDRVQRWVRKNVRRSRLVRNGEWWYGTFLPEIYVEGEIAPIDEPEEWKFHVFNGRCLYLQNSEMQGGRSISHTLYDPEFTHIPVQICEKKIGEVKPVFPALVQMKRAAERICRTISYARVDFYWTKADRIYLGEITFCPNDANNYYSDPRFDENIGSKWDHRDLYSEEQINRT